MEAFPAQFGACLGVFDFARAHPPAGPPTGDEAGQLILWTFARSAKTYGAAVRLAGAGYGEQGVMLDRSLFEDMLIAHWVKRHPLEAPEAFKAHAKYIQAKRSQALRKVGHSASEEPKPEEMKELQKRFGRGTWTGLTLGKIIEDVRPEWNSSPLDVRIFDEMTLVVHGFNNQLLHHGAVGLTIAGIWDENENTVRFGTGPSQHLVRAALTGAFWSFANVYSLVMDASVVEEFNALYARLLAAFLEQSSELDEL